MTPRLLALLIVFLVQSTLAWSRGLDSASSTCAGNSLVPTTSSQALSLSSNYETTTTFSCDSESGSSPKTAYYTSFNPSTNGNYFLKVTGSVNRVVLEIRRGNCTESAYYCSSSLAGSTTSAGYNQVYLESGVKYYVLVGSYNSDSLSSQYLTAGYCGSSCNSNSGAGGTEYPGFGTVELALSANAILLAVPMVLFFIALVIVAVFCFMGGNKVMGEPDIPVRSCTMCGASSMVKLRRIAISTWLFSALVWVTNWAVFWSALAYVFALITFVEALMIYGATGISFSGSSLATGSKCHKDLLLACGVILILNALVGTAQVGVAIAGISRECAGNGICLAWLMPTQIMGVIAVLGMIILGALSINLGITLHDASSQVRTVGIGSGGLIVDTGFIPAQGQVMVAQVVQPEMSPKAYAGHVKGGQVLSNPSMETPV